MCRCVESLKYNINSLAGTILDYLSRMRRLFFVITIFYLLLSTVGIISVSTRLLTVRDKVESLAEAQRSLIKRAEFKGLIYGLQRSIEQNEGRSEVMQLIKRSKEVIGECYGCHHPEQIIERIKEAERNVNQLVMYGESDKYQNLLAVTKRVIPFVETAYERATFLAKARLELARREIKRAERAGALTVISGILLFFIFSVIALYRVSNLQSKVKDREEGLKNWAEQWQQTFDSIQDCLLILDESGRVKMINKSAKVLFGEGITDRFIVDILDIPSIKGCEDLFSSSSGCEFSMEGRLFHLKAYPHRIDQRDKGYIVVIRDVTADKEMQQRLIQAEKLSALSRMMAGIATELYNPLASVSEYSEVLLDISSINKRIREIADKISMSTSRMSGVVGELLLFSKVPLLNKIPVDLRDLLDEVLGSIRKGMDLRDLNLTVESEGVTIPIDRAKMQRALFSLITNSINRVIRSKKGDSIMIRCYEEMGLSHIDISDNGPFIPRHMTHRVFEPFFSDGEDSRKVGLDLSISYNIIKAHGGDIIVKSTADETVFSIELPLVNSSTS